MNNGNWKEGAIIAVRVDFEKGRVSWAVNGTTTKTVNNKYLLDRTIKWVPFMLICGRSVLSIVN